MHTLISSSSPLLHFTVKRLRVFHEVTASTGTRSHSNSIVSDKLIIDDCSAPTSASDYSSPTQYDPSLTLLRHLVRSGASLL